MHEQQQSIQQVARDSVTSTRDELFVPVIARINKTKKAMAIDEGDDCKIGSSNSTSIYLQPAKNNMLPADMRKLSLK